MNGCWVSPDIRDSIVSAIEKLQTKTGVKKTKLLKAIRLQPGKFYNWKRRFGLPNNHNGKIPRDFWLEPWEKKAIIKYKKDYPEEGYKRLTYMMMDHDIVAVSPSTTYRILKEADLLNKWNNKSLGSKRKGFTQPIGPHEHWHVDISYINFFGSYLFLITVLDGYSRYVVHHELRMQMCEYDVTLTIQRALDKYPDTAPRIISDNGGQFRAKEFKIFISNANLEHVRTSVNHPQSNGKLEAWHKTVKSECIRRQSMLSIDDARNKIFQWVDEYNNTRLHSGINYVAPVDRLTGRDSEIFKERDLKLELARKRRKQNNKQSNLKAA